MNLSKRAVAAAAALVVLALPACGGSEPAVKAHGTTDASSEARSDKRITLDLGLSFASPKDWDAIATDSVGDALKDGPGGDAMDELAGRMGADPAQFREQIKSLEVFLAAPHADQGFLANINAIEATGALPSKGAAELQYRSIGGDDLKVTELKVAGEDALTVSYALAVKALTVHGEALLVEHGGKTAIVTISTGSADETAHLADGIITSMKVD